ncbi:hypothetical protein OHA79_00135 [Streptomyces sp. NBC_00841]|uniref:hypothetical protein n=1 Tax=Streptomyces sp. NBC_00841 TaxID=2975847 RepID=UPI002DDAE428|nr:hypothetical protein [Streptomyces sp. NBC_00841]WRZ96526.1 hypothetical protein OHA79_00135 [Streptomyces sp. NBC_00841]
MIYCTVKQFADAATPEELFTGQWQNRASVHDEYKTYLDDRWSEGCKNACCGRRSFRSGTRAATSASAPTCTRSALRCGR